MATDSPTIQITTQSDITELELYATDGGYEAANGSGVNGDLYYNTTSNVIRWHNGTAWTTVVGIDATQTLTNKTIDDELTLKEIAAPSSPASGYHALYFDSTDNRPRWKDSGGSVFDFVPAGVILPYGGTSAPNGWLLCDGSTVSRTTYAELFSVIGSAFGDGDGSTTFHLPDTEGRFLRFHDNAAGRDPDAGTRTAMNSGGNTGDNVGSVQAEDLLAHTHTVNTDNSSQFVGGSGGKYATSAGDCAVDVSSSTGGNETRPINFYATGIIKF